MVEECMHLGPTARIPKLKRRELNLLQQIYSYTTRIHSLIQSHTYAPMHSRTMSFCSCLY